MKKNLPVKPGILIRPRINSLLNMGIETSFLTIIAGIGYGKTQAVASFLQNSKKRVIWHTVMKMDNSSRRFWEKFTESLCNELPNISKQLEDLDFPDSIAKYDIFLRIFTKELYAGEKIIIVLDDYHNIINNNEVRRFFRYISEADLENFCLIIISNEKSALNLAGFNSMGGIFLISADDLKFTNEEAYELFKAYDNEISEKEISEIVNKTDGWPLALYLTNLQCKKDPHNILGHHSQPPLITELFEHGFFRTYDEKFQMLLLKLALVPNFSIDFIKEVGGYPFTEALELLGNNAFIFHDSDDHSFLFQKMYRDFLTSLQPLLEESEVSRVYSIAGDLARSNNNYMEALDYYRHSKNYDNILDTIKNIPNIRKRVGMSDFVIGCLSEIPEDYHNYKFVNFLKAFQYLNKMDVSSACRLFENLRDEFEKDPTEENKALLGEVYIVLGDISILYNSDAFCDYFKKAAAFLPNGSWVRKPEIMYVDNNSLFFLPSNEKGQLEYIVDKLFECVPYAEQFANGCGYGFEYLFAAEAMFYLNELEKSREYCYNAIYKANEKKQHDIICNAYFLLVRISIFYGSYVQAKENLTKITDHINNNNLVYLYELRDYAENWFYIKIGDLNKVTNWVASGKHDEKILNVGVGRNTVIYAYYLMAKNEYVQASAVLLQMNNEFVQRGSWVSKLIIYIYLAECYFKLRHYDLAVDCFWKAYDMTYNNNLSAPFIEGGMTMRQIISLAKKSKKYKFDIDWIENMANKALVYSKCYNTIVNRYRIDNKIDSERGIKLTERELEVLNYLAQGLTRENIAEQMEISINGVKKHITKIYDKLGAINRADAIHIAVLKGYITKPW